MKRAKKFFLISALCFGFTFAAAAAGEGDLLPSVSLQIGAGEGADTLKLFFALTILSLLPSILIMTTSFTRIIIVFSFVRNALGLQQTPPNQVLVGLALFLSLFIMSPVIEEINETAYTPYANGQITQSEALDRASVPLRGFMLRQTKTEDLKLFLSLSNKPAPADPSDIPMPALLCSFLTSEIKRAFLIGFLLFLPFLIIDMVVASVLMSMGMMMLPPVMISLPFKIMLFVLADGWGLLVKTLVTGFH